MILRGILPQIVLVIVASFVLTTVETKEPSVRVYPPNVAVAYNIGRYEFFLGCEVTDLPANTYIEWIYYPIWQPNGIIIYSTHNNINNDPTNFTVKPMLTVGRTSHLNLVIKTVKPELATQYECNLTPIPGFGKSTKVVAIGNVECISNVDVYDEGDEVNMSCSVNYHDSTKTYSPWITWNRHGKMVPGVVQINESSTRNTAIMPKNMTAADDNQEFTCIVDFVNANLTYSDHRYCSTVLVVNHAVSNITFKPPSSAEAPTNVAVGDVVDCVANGRPAPRIEWYDTRWNLVSGWRKLVVTSAMRSWGQPITVHCQATSYSYRKVKMTSVEGTYVFNVIDAAPTAQKGGVEAWVIAVAVIVPIVVIAATAIATLFIIRHREMKKKSTTKTAKGSAAALLFNY